MSKMGALSGPHACPAPATSSQSDRSLLKSLTSEKEEIEGVVIKAAGAGKKQTKKTVSVDSPGRPVVKTLCFRPRGVRVRSLVGELRSPMPWGN